MLDRTGVAKAAAGVGEPERTDGGRAVVAVASQCRAERGGRRETASDRVDAAHEGRRREGLTGEGISYEPERVAVEGRVQHLLLAGRSLTALGQYREALAVPRTGVELRLQ